MRKIELFAIYCCCFSCIKVWLQFFSTKQKWV